ncbi:MAG: hypothetical protein QHH00_07765 [Methanomassiliicoccales archaeon]|jgi:transposase-like protein|nr:hypothetical protein [Methanomassiliicoccales archaeon]
MDRKIKRLIVCPQCGSSDLYYEAGLMTGYKYHCKKCNYIGAFVIEVEIESEETGNERNSKRT